MRKSLNGHLSTRAGQSSDTTTWKLWTADTFTSLSEQIIMYGSFYATSFYFGGSWNLSNCVYTKNQPNYKTGFSFCYLQLEEDLKQYKLPGIYVHRFRFY